MLTVHGSKGSRTSESERSAPGTGVVNRSHGRDGWSGVLGCPRQRVIGYFFPALLADRVVRAAGELLVFRDRLRVPKAVRGLFADRRRDDVIGTTADDQQRRAVVIEEIDAVGRARIEVCERTLEQESARAGTA
jgi:hypothetical protein